MSGSETWYDKPGSILWVDVETTGLNPHKHSLLEAAFYLTDRRGVPCTDPFSEFLSSLVFSGNLSGVDPAAMTANMRDLDLMSDPEKVDSPLILSQWGFEFKRRIIKHSQAQIREGHFFDVSRWPISVAGWNVAFDVRWLQVVAGISLFSFENPDNYLESLIDVKPMFWGWSGERLSLRPAFKRMFGHGLSLQHSALEDAKAASQIYRRIVESFTQKEGDTDHSA